MDRYVYHYDFDENSDPLKIRKAVNQTLIATRALHGEFLVGILTHFRFIARKRRLVVRGVTGINQDFAKILSAFIQNTPELNCTVRLRRVPRRTTHKAEV